MFNPDMIKYFQLIKEKNLLLEFGMMFNLMRDLVVLNRICFPSIPLRIKEPSVNTL